MQTVRRGFGLFFLLTVAFGGRAWAQSDSTDGSKTRRPRPIISSITVRNINVFDPDDAEKNFLFRLANGLHFVTRPWVVRRELLFESGQPYDSAAVEETLRNLRSMKLFRDVEVDTVYVGDQVDVQIRASDGWTTSLQIDGKTTAGDFTWALGFRERNVLGTATQAFAKFRKDPDRNTLTLEVRQDRLIANKIAAKLKWNILSDGTFGEWIFGKQFRATTERYQLETFGNYEDRRLLQFRDGIETENFWQRRFLQRVVVGYAPRANTSGYIRVGGEAFVKREERLLAADTLLAIPDTVTAAVGVWAELLRTNFRVTQHYMAFARDVDVDLSTRLRATVWLAPEVFGYARNGIGPAIDFQTGAGVGRFFGKFTLKANALFNSRLGGFAVDSGRVTSGITIVSQHLPRQATVLHVEGGMMKNIPGGEEFDLGFGIGPRGFGIHSFTGSRQAWMTVEHRVFLIDEIGKLFGVGLAGFLDYGGAWFDDQSARVGGNVGFGIRLSSTRSGGPTVGRLDWSYRFGQGFPAGKRWAFSIGRNVPF